MPFLLAAKKNLEAMVTVFTPLNSIMVDKCARGVNACNLHFDSRKAATFASEACSSATGEDKLWMQAGQSKPALT